MFAEMSDPDSQSSMVIECRSESRRKESRGKAPLRDHGDVTGAVEVRHLQLDPKQLSFSIVNTAKMNGNMCSMPFTLTHQLRNTMFSTSRSQLRRYASGSPAFQWKSNLPSTTLRLGARTNFALPRTSYKFVGAATLGLGGFSFLTTQKEIHCEPRESSPVSIFACRRLNCGVNSSPSQGSSSRHFFV